ncbi:3-oxoadipyl-CoA thiolase [Endozoicomonadaceae bacterium StTr2]
MAEAYICDGVRTPFGRYGGSLASIRADDLGAIPLKELMNRHPGLDWQQLDDVIYGNANQAGEDNRNVARMSALLAGLPCDVPGSTMNRLCGSGMDAIGTAARAIKSGEANLIIAGGCESMSRAPFVMGKAETAFSRATNGLYDTTIGWRFINPKMEAEYGVDSMPETAENVAEQFNISRADQDRFALLSQQKAAAAQEAGRFQPEIVPVNIPRRKKESVLVAADEHLRPDTTLDGLSGLKTPFRSGGSVTAGNASGVNDGAVALLLASQATAEQYNLKRRGRVVGMACAGLEPRIMGYGPVLAVQKLLNNTGLSLPEIDVIELNEAFAAQSLACIRGLGLSDDDSRINPNGGAIALGHPLGASGARLVLTALHQLEMTGGRYALCSMCIGVGQGIALIIERI